MLIFSGLDAKPESRKTARSGRRCAISLTTLFGYISVKTGDQVAVVVGVDGAAAQLLGLVRQGQRQPPFNQAAEQQVEVGAVILDVGFHLSEKVLIVVTGRVINVLHVGGIQLEHAETDVEFGVWRVKSGVVICQLLFQNFFSCSSDSLFSDFADIFVACFVGFALLRRTSPGAVP